MKKLILTGLLVLSACSSISEGVITDKKFYDEYTTLMPIYTFNSNGTISGMYTQEIYTPPCWQFFLKNNEEVGSVCVEPRDYMVYNVGQHYTMPENIGE